MSLPPLRRSLLPRIALLASLVAGAVTAAHADEGPIIGVLIASGSLDRRLEVGPGGMVIEYPGGSEQVVAGSYLLRLDATHARIADWRLPRTTPFRFRGLRSAVGVTTADGGDIRSYDGWIEVPAPGAEGDWEVINRLPLERYLLGVLPGETPTSLFDPEALKAQAVASRTYALFQVLARPGSRVHLRSDTRSQVFLGSGLVDEAARAAIEATRGQVLTSDGRIFEAFFHSTCGGATRPVEACFGGSPLDALTGVTCEGCGHSSRATWEARVSMETLGEVLAPICRRHGIELGAVRTIEPIDPSLGGHCAYVRVVHERGAFELESESFRRALLARKVRCLSTSFVVTRSGELMKFVGRGWGHGVGLCQYGADGYARKGYGYRAILEYFYQRSRIEALW